MTVEPATTTLIQRLLCQRAVDLPLNQSIRETEGYPPPSVASKRVDSNEDSLSAQFVPDARWRGPGLRSGGGSAALPWAPGASVPRTKILQKMKGASVLILPSTWYEGFPVTLAEACAAGLPVIASKLGSMSSIVDHQRTGLHFEEPGGSRCDGGISTLQKPP